MKPLLHMWSLGVEEQFYFVWPVFLLLMARLNRPVLTLMLIAALAVLSFAAHLLIFPRIPADQFLSALHALLGVDDRCRARGNAGGRDAFRRFTRGPQRDIRSGVLLIAGAMMGDVHERLGRFRGCGSDDGRGHVHHRRAPGVAEPDGVLVAARGLRRSHQLSTLSLALAAAELPADRADRGSRHLSPASAAHGRARLCTGHSHVSPGRAARAPAKRSQANRCMARPVDACACRLGRRDPRG